MKVGIHLPQFGRAAGPEAIARAAKQAEDLGYADVWVSDHIVRPAAQNYPSPMLYDPLMTLTFAAAVTERIGLGTSVLVAPQHNPLWLAKALATLDVLSKGRVVAALGAGWSKGEFDALGLPFTDRGARMDEIIDILRAAWGPDPVAFSGQFWEFDDLLVLPKPDHQIPLWIGGASDRAFRRTKEKGDGYQALGLSIESAPAMVQRVRADHPEESFTISLRTGWDAQGMEPDQIRREYDAWQAAGVQHVVSAPWRSSMDEWLRSVELLAEIVHPGQ
ncbi:MAG: LLM class F420-dependent oxidoreductase [Acidimicrobiia bacterium]